MGLEGRILLSGDCLGSVSVHQIRDPVYDVEEDTVRIQPPLDSSRITSHLSTVTRFIIIISILFDYFYSIRLLLLYYYIIAVYLLFLLYCNTIIIIIILFISLSSVGNNALSSSDDGSVALHDLNTVSFKTNKQTNKQ